METFTARLITPEQIVFENEVESVILRTEDGDSTYLAGHSPLVGAVVPGEVRFVGSNGDTKAVQVEAGFVYVKGDVTVLVPKAVEQ